ncbi:MAG: hypothetical protein AB8B72_00350 [Crocinitomicaceae bacterium]
MKYILLLVVFCAIFSSCKKEGCTKSQALNYDSKADEDDGSCLIMHTGIYFVKDSIFYNNEFFKYQVFDLKVEFLSTEDSVVLRNIPGVSITRDLIATKTETTLSIPLQPFDQNANAEGSGTFDFGLLKFELNYGVVRHSCIATKN